MTPQQMLALFTLLADLQSANQQLATELAARDARIAELEADRPVEDGD